MNHRVHVADIIDDAAIEFAQHMIMVAGKIKNFGAVSGFLKNRLHDLVIDHRPMPFFLCQEKVEDISHQIQKLGFGMQEKIKQLFVSQVFFPQMQVRYPDGPELMLRHESLLRMCAGWWSRGSPSSVRRTMAHSCPESLAQSRSCCLSGTLYTPPLLSFDHDPVCIW